MSQMIRAKFRCESVTHHSVNGEPRYSAKFFPVFPNGDPNHENSKFWQASPSGSLELQTVKINPFRPGAEYYVDFTEVAGT
jgi:hypothetical protein